MYDVVIIGSGWAGFNAAVRLKKLGWDACLIEKAEIGGTCLNTGCIPTKTLIQSAKIFSLAQKSSVFGVDSANPIINFSRVQERKEKVIQQLREGMQYQIKEVDFLKTEAKLVSDKKVLVEDKVLNTRLMLIAVGSRPIELSTLRFDGQRIISSDDILSLKEIPASLLIVGGGVIGCEFASLFSILGTQVTIVEKMLQLLPGEDSEIARKLQTNFHKKGIKVQTNTDVTTLDLNGYSKILVCVGRAPRTEGMGLEEVGIKLVNGKILVNEYLQTNIPTIYAAGDCTGKLMLAHFAAYQGRVAAENLGCLKTEDFIKADNATVSNCIFTDPEIASVGMNEEGAKACGRQVNVNKFDFLGSGMARILDETEGFIKIVSDKQSSQVIGASIIGPRATELIGILTLAITNQLSVEQIKNTIFAHPTLSESITEVLR